MGRAILTVKPTLRSMDVDVVRPIEWTAAYTEGGSYDESIANGITNQSMNMLGVSSALLVVVTAKTGTITARLNSATGTAFELSVGDVVAIAGAGITAIYVTNSSGSAQTVGMMVAG